ncbi:MAG TPA: cbb3-type cytochrome c oxidase subunit I [Gammaproteobacteria bacterium]|nr:cbb3-type cytochrome c oxidase subunit I [Gammaproteobacteria bacterium]
MTQDDYPSGYRVETQLVAAHAAAALATLLISVTFGIAISHQFFAPDAMGTWLPTGWGRLRYAHTQGIMLGWLGNAFLAFLYHAVPVLTGHSITSRRLGYWLFGVWNFAVIVPGWVLVLAGISQPLEWAEFPLVVDAFALLGLGLAALQFLPPFFRRGLETLYVSSWYIIGSLIFTFLAFPMGNVLPEIVPGAAGAAFSGLWIHDAVGLFVTPLALAILYFVIPASTGRPIFSHFLSMLGFWGLFFLYPLNGTHHYVYSVIPMGAQLGAIAASSLLGVIVVIVVTNLLLSLRGAGVFPRDVALRFVAMSTIFYVVVSVQGALQAQMSLNRAVHFTDWVIGHSHLAMLGFATFAGLGGLIHAWQRIPWARYNARALDWAYWLLVVGIVIMVIDLTIAGIVQAGLWLDGAPWLESIRAARPYWIVRTVAAIPIAAGFVAVVVGLSTGPRGAGRSVLELRPTPPTEVVAPSLAMPGAARILAMSYVVATIAGLAFFAMSVSLLGIWPHRVLAEQTTAMAPANTLGLTAAEERGRVIYAREGCAYCHTQQIRYTSADIQRFGAPTLAWETQFDYPHLWGTRRIGPDLTRAGATRTTNWHYVHLFAPRTVVPLSIMPSYAALFDGSPDRPSQAARDLVAYLETLGRARELAWPEGDAAARAAAPDDHWAQMAFDAPMLNAHPARTRPRGDVPLLPATPAHSAAGQALWQENCAGCHGGTGRGDGPAAPWLEPRPTNLAAREYSRRRIADALWNGVLGTSMPAWRERSLSELALLADVVAGFAETDAGPTPSVPALALGARVYAGHCVECHGAAGAGDGFAAGELPIAPTDFRAQRVTRAEGLRTLREGIEGTSMAPWTDRLSEQEIDAVAHYVRTFFTGDAE